MSDSRYAHVPNIELEDAEDPRVSPQLPFPPLNESAESPPTNLDGGLSAREEGQNRFSGRSSMLSESASQKPEKDRRPSSVFSIGFEKIYESFTPSQHQLLDPTQQSTVRRYDKRAQRHRLWQLTIGEFFLTIVLCVTYFVILYKYSHKTTMSNTQRRTFNALVTTNALLLGVNLSASLRSYVKMLRWRMLSIKFRPLETFDLVMGCDSLINVIKLLYKGANPGKKSPSQTQVYAVIWLLVNLSATLLVGVVGLTYNLDSSRNYVRTRTGPINITDLSSILTDDLQQSLSTVNTWGLRGYLYKPLRQDTNRHQFHGNYESYGDGYSRYFFVDWSADGSDRSIISDRYLDTGAECEGYYVSEGAEGNLPYVVYDNGVEFINQSLPEPPGPAGSVFLADTDSGACGDRCTYVEVFVAKSDKQAGPNSGVVPEPQDAYYYRCINVVSTVSDWYVDLAHDYQFPDHQARILAGAVGWSGKPVNGDTRQFVTYPASNQVHFTHSPNSTEMAAMVSEFTTKAVAAMDTIYPGITRKTVQGEQPIDAQVLVVNWRWAGAFLGILPFMHFWTLMCVIIWANKAVIKDDSHLAVAQAYNSLLQGLDGKGCMLRGEEISRKLGHPEVIYGFTSPGQTQEDPGHIDVYDDTSGVKPERSFKEGTFDGWRDQKPPGKGRLKVKTD